MSATDWTAVGTIALAAATLIAVVTTIIITAQERKRADERLGEERGHSATQLEDERRHAREREQLAEAYKVQVVLGEKAAGEPTDSTYEEPDESVRQLVAIVVNHGAYTITRVEAQFSYDGNSLNSHRRTEHLSGFQGMAHGLRSGWEPTAGSRRGSTLAPWDAGMRFESDRVHEKFLAGPYPVVRWTDRWGTRWEHKHGEVKQVDESTQWLP